MISARVPPRLIDCLQYIGVASVGAANLYGLGEDEERNEEQKESVDKPREHLRAYVPA